MSRTTFRNTVLGIGATAAAIALGYFGVQYNGRNNMFTIAAAWGCRCNQLCTSETDSRRITYRTDKNPKEKKQVMSDHDTVHTQPSLTTTEIMTIILGCEQNS